MSVICNYAEKSHLTLYAKDRRAAGGDHLDKLVNVELGAGDIVLFDHGAIHREH